MMHVLHLIAQPRNSQRPRPGNQRGLPVQQCSSSLPKLHREGEATRELHNIPRLSKIIRSKHTSHPQRAPHLLHSAPSISILSFINLLLSNTLHLPTIPLKWPVLQVRHSLSPQYTNGVSRRQGSRRSQKCRVHLRYLPFQSLMTIVVSHLTPALLHLFKYLHIIISILQSLTLICISYILIVSPILKWFTIILF